ncbi:MAG: hypothetical protein IJU79_03060 [Desulfovibrionaceae bacterium]|nr:hypothetical protein [Desulfovibrionaceae bacterium]
MNTNSCSQLINVVDKNMDIWKNINKHISPGQAHFFNRLQNAIPVCWFGHLDSSAPKVLTFGQNPSFHEFPSYLSKPRFNASVTSPVQDVITSYNRYFDINPYNAWFGSIEKLLNLFSSSYYSNSQYSSVAIHFDAYSISTRKSDDINKLTKLTNVLSLLSKNFFDLVEKQDNIEKIIITGSHNYDLFKSIIGISNEKKIKIPVSFSRNSFKFIKAYHNGIPVFCTSAYLPNFFGKINYSEIYNILINI